MTKKNSILIIIPARGGSKGVKLKNLRKVLNKNLLQIAIEFSKKLNVSNYICVSSDHKKILKIAEENNVLAIKRPFNLSLDYVSDYKVIEHSIKYLEKKLNIDFNFIIYLQPTSPFRKKKDLIFSLKKVMKNSFDASFSVSKASLKYHPKKIFKFKQNSRSIELYLKSGSKIVARQQLDNICIRNGIFYIFNKKKLLIKKTIYLDKIYPYFINYNYVNIDSLKDLALSRKIAKFNKLDF